MQCLKCGGEMHKLPFDGVLIDYCHKPDCNCVWVDGDEVEKLEHRTKRRETSLSIGDLVNQAKREVVQERLLEQTDHLCPRCPSKRLNRATSHDLTVEQCPLCHGMFFDQGEFERAFAPRTVFTRVKEWLSRLCAVLNNAPLPH